MSSRLGSNRVNSYRGRGSPRWRSSRGRWTACRASGGGWSDLRYRPTLAGHACLLTHPGAGGHLLLAIADRAKLEQVLPRVLDPGQFLSDYGLRSLSKGLAAEPYHCHGRVVAYEPGESTTAMYGGNSNWRGPVWFPVNYLMIGALREYHRYDGDALRTELPRGSGRSVSLGTAADELAARLVRIFLRDEGRGERPVLGNGSWLQADPHWRDLIPFSSILP